jgi:hypothetical protein
MGRRRTSAGIAGPRWSSSRSCHRDAPFALLPMRGSSDESDPQYATHVSAPSTSTGADRGTYRRALPNWPTDHHRPRATMGLDAVFSTLNTVARQNHPSLGRRLPVSFDSNPHSYVHSLQHAAASRGFLPWGLSNACLLITSHRHRFRAVGRHLTILTNSGRLETPHRDGMDQRLSHFLYHPGGLSGLRRGGARDRDAAVITNATAAGAVRRDGVTRRRARSGCAVSGKVMAAAGRETGGERESASVRPSLGRTRGRNADLHADGRADVVGRR